MKTRRPWTEASMSVYTWKHTATFQRDNTSASAENKSRHKC